jgi:acyl dehydratase
MLASAARHFTPADQQAFVALSGDANPMHVDAVAARRLLFGGPVVHGVHLLLWALDEVAKLQTIRSFEAHFVGPVLVGDGVTLREGNRPGLLEIQGAGAVATQIRVELGEAPAGLPVSDAAQPPGMVLAREAAELAQDAGSLPLYLDAALAAKLFPNLLRRQGAAWLADCLAATRLVGMICPGRDSVFGQLSMKPAANPEAAFSYRVAQANAHLRLLRIALNGAALQGSATAFIRPPPVQQITAAAARQRVAPDAFSGRQALVLGGSRGLGEATAKLLAAGGARVTLTYRQGGDDAEQIAAEINATGGHAQAMLYDAGIAASLPPGIFDQAYYFATPHLGRLSRADALEPILVHGFAALAAALRARSPGRLALFYPSTVFLDERPAGFEAYCAAKAKAEALCETLSRQPDMVLCAPRLPRLQTDQTASIIPKPAAEPAAVLLPWLFAMRDKPPGLYANLPEQKS